MKKNKNKNLEQKPKMGYCPFEHWLGWAQGARHGMGTGARGTGARARALGAGQAGVGRQARCRRTQGRAGGGMRCWARHGRAARAARELGARPGRAAGPTGSALGSLSLFLSGLTRYFSGV